jgi:sugar phosphate isomerase/epimerase
VNAPSRREWLAATAGVVATGMVAGQNPTREPFRYCLNTSTIRGQNLSLVDEIDIAARAGYQGIEPWARELDQHVRGGGNLKDIAKRVGDRGLVVEDVIGFPEWVVDDDARRGKGLEEAKRVMDMVRQIGGRRMAAPPVGATSQTDLDLYRAAERYRALLDIGEQMGVVPQLEIWGFSKSLSRLSEAAFVAIESGHPRSCILADVYHIHKGGGYFNGLRQLAGANMHIFHMNDFPADPPRSEISDSHRVYPGDGTAPMKQIIRYLTSTGFKGALSLELFNKEYWKQDALAVARTGLEKMRAVVNNALQESGG